ncbi:histidine phosphatase family protein [Sphaerimonospora thailandensis]|uniref:Histidine phosphatase family protein n=1 Tax=Sphaerimonospora thailandensis TaxID=795644 RepID=A0A8J3W0M8_9ACTN|nr:histidine phosphatase family protein [Sphaerimonospora thailandensis]GIH71268.1 hypothetical protein Mth01_35210 [Sphaerimonospora thailandensis]
MPPSPIPGVAELIVVRHGESTANIAFAAARASGALDLGLTCRDAEVPLSPLGCRQAARLGVHLSESPADERPEVVLCSPYVRARQTLEITSAVVAACGPALPPPRFDDRLRDRVMGELELLSDAAIEARFPAEARRRRTVGELHSPKKMRYPEVGSRSGRQDLQLQWYTPGLMRLGRFRS